MTKARQTDRDLVLQTDEVRHPQPGGSFSMNGRPFFVVGTIICHAMHTLIQWIFGRIPGALFEKMPFLDFILRALKAQNRPFMALTCLGAPRWLVRGGKWIKFSWEHGKWPIWHYYNPKGPSFGVPKGPKRPSFGPKYAFLVPHLPWTA